MYQAKSIWEAAKNRIDSNYFASDEAENVNKVCLALLKINPYLKECEDFVTNKMTQAPAPAPVTPANKARNAADFFAAIDLTKEREPKETEEKAFAKVKETIGLLDDPNTVKGEHQQIVSYCLYVQSFHHSL
jgi:hypothetical protein